MHVGSVHWSAVLCFCLNIAAATPPHATLYIGTSPTPPLLFLPPPPFCFGTACGTLRCGVGRTRPGPAVLNEISTPGLWCASISEHGHNQAVASQCKAPGGIATRRHANTERETHTGTHTHAHKHTHTHPHTHTPC